MAQQVREGWVSTKDLLSDLDISFLKELYCPDTPAVDIVAVHGLRIPVNFKPWKDPHSFGAKTWIAGVPGEEKIWLKDFLPADIPDARVFLFGYNSNVGLDTSIAGPSGAADDLLAKLRNARRSSPQRPLLFFCHSLGGIVTKQAIAKAKSSRRYEELFHAVRGVAFFATPHRGGLGAEEGRAAAGALRRFTGNVRTPIMEALLADSSYAFDIHQSFLEALGRIRICTFYELKPMPGLRQLVVARNSAVLGLTYPEENVVPVPESNHSTICKFASRTQNYELVIQALCELVDWAKQRPRSSSGAQSLSSQSSRSDISNDEEPRNRDAQLLTFTYSLENMSLEDGNSPDKWKISRKPLARKAITKKGPFYLLPNSLDCDFIGRQAILDTVRELLMATGQRSLHIALYGLGGAGKTSVALQTLLWYRTEFPDRSIFWIQANSVDLMRQSLTEIGARCGLLENGPVGQPLDIVREFLLDPTNGKWLIFIDNADTMDLVHLDGNVGNQRQYKLSLQVMLSYYVPRCWHGSVLYTTRSKAIGEKLTCAGHVIEVGPLDRQASRRMLLSRMGNESLTVKSPPLYQKEVPADEDVDKLCDHLDHIPLALSQASAFMRQQNVTISEYLDLIEQDESRLTHVLENDFMTMTSDRHWSKAVASTWNLTFHQIESNVPEAAELLHLMAYLAPQNIPRFFLKALIPDEWTLTTTALGTLQSFSLVNAGSDYKSFNQHLLVQLATRRRLEGAESAEKNLNKVLEALCMQFPRGGYDVWPRCAALLPHALQALKHAGVRPTNMLPARAIATLQAKISKYYYQQWLFPQALDFSEQALEAQPTDTKEDKALALDVKDIQVWALKGTGDLDAAEALAKEAWLERQHLLGAKHVDTLKTYQTLALMLKEQGRYEEATKAARSALKSLQKTQPDDDLRIIDMKQRLGSLVRMSGELDEAEKLVRESVDGGTKQLGGEDILTLKYRWQLGRILHDQGKFEEAEELNRETAAIQERIDGENSLDALKTSYLLANNLKAQGKFEAAIACARKVHNGAHATVGPNNPYTWFAAERLAACLTASTPDGKDEGKLAEAATLYQRVLAGRQGRLRPDHPESLTARTDVATVQRLRGDPAGAEALERETYKKLRATLGPAHPWTLASREGLARALWAQRDGPDGKAKGKEAAEEARKLLKHQEKRVGWRHLDTRRAAELVIEMVADGKERERLGKKLMESVRKTADL